MAKKRKTLTDPIRAEIVVRFARYWSSTQVQEWLREEHKIEMEYSALAHYNLDNGRSAKGLGEKWQKLFREARARYNDELDRIPGASLAWRIEQLTQWAVGMAGDGNRIGAALLLKQASEDLERTAKAPRKGGGEGPAAADAPAEITVRFVKPDGDS